MCMVIDDYENLPAQDGGLSLNPLSLHAREGQSSGSQDIPQLHRSILMQRPRRDASRSKHPSKETPPSDGGLMTLPQSH